jgi:hypothetical protein
MHKTKAMHQFGISLIFEDVAFSHRYPDCNLLEEAIDLEYRKAIIMPINVEALNLLYIYISIYYNMCLKILKRQHE